MYEYAMSIMYIQWYPDQNLVRLNPEWIFRYKTYTPTDINFF